jgi:hypothetical protein
MRPSRCFCSGPHQDRSRADVHARPHRANKPERTRWPLGRFGLSAGDAHYRFFGLPAVLRAGPTAMAAAATSAGVVPP